MSVKSARSLTAFLIAFVLALACGLRAGAQGGNQPSQGGATGSRVVATAVRVSEVPTIDGVLDEQVWQQAKALKDFVQAEPLEGQPASEQTEVRLLYDDQAVFVGVTLHDSDPSQIVTTESRRDSALGDQDSFQVILDTFRDRENGFVFGTNAAGIQYDAQVRNQSNPSTSWDGSWDVRTHVNETSWTAA